jgi:hypothetical protein
MKDIIKYSPSSVSNKELVDTWIDIYHDEYFVIVLYDAVNYSDILKKLGISNKLNNLFESKIVVCEFQDLQDAKDIFSILCNTDSPYCSFYVKGKYITDSIEESIKNKLNNSDGR